MTMHFETDFSFGRVASAGQQTMKRAGTELLVLDLVRKSEGDSDIEFPG